jgi:hypothetical protein
MLDNIDEHLTTRPLVEARHCFNFAEMALAMLPAEILQGVIEESIPD